MSVPAAVINPAVESTMVTAVTEHERYPGTRSFSDDAVDHRLFFGRNVEAEELFHRVRASRLLVLFGKSGLGKTSLLQAGLYPKLRAQNLLPIPIRLNEPGVNPVSRVIDAVLDTCRIRGIDCEPGSRDGLWAFFKSTDLWQGELLTTPVLVFDQFEEIFTLQDAAFRKTLAGELRDLSSRRLPQSIRNRRAAGERLMFSDTPPALHIILSLREEYVGSLEELVTDVTGIFEHRFQLKAMDDENASLAIVKPAKINESSVFSVQPFDYKESTLKVMLEFLRSRTGEIEPFQLQILCQHVEHEVAKRQGKGEQNILVDEQLLGGKKGLDRILQNFYGNALQNLRKLHGSRQCRRAKYLCEQALLNPDGRRVSVDEGSIRRQYKINEKCFETLIRTRLLRKETRPGLEGYYYELSHDSLALPIQEGRQRRRKLKALSLLALVASLIAYGFFVSWGYKQQSVQTAQANNNLATVTQQAEQRVDNLILANQLAEEAHQLVNIGNLEQAQMKISLATNLAPEQAEFHRMQASLLSSLGNYNKAAVAYQEAIKLAPDDPENFIQRGLNRLQTGDTTGAIADFNESIRLDKDNSDGYYYLGSAYSSMNEWESAIKAYDTAIKQNPEYGEAYFERGVAHTELRKVTDDLAFDVDAVADFEHVLKTGVDPEIAAAAKARLEKLGAKPEAPAISLSVYYQDAKDEAEVKSIASRLVRNSGHLNRVKKSSSRTSGTGNVVYYYESDRAQAQNIQTRAMKFLAAKGIPARLTLRYQSAEKSPKPVKPGHIEVWFPSLSQSAPRVKSTRPSR